MTRVDPPYAADERAMLLAYLDFLRETMVMKLDGLSEDQARWTPAPSANSLISIVQHLGYVENWWFSTCFAGGRSLWKDGDDLDADFRVDPDRPIADVVAFYRHEWEKANEVIRAAGSLDDESVAAARGAQRTLRWILVHMIEETARHAGHADITRELVDGSVGE